MSWRRVGDVSALREEVQHLDLRLSVGLRLAAVLPPLVGTRLRTRLIRLVGIRIGASTAFGGRLEVQGVGRPASRITIGSFCWFNAGCTLDASAPITIGDRVAFGQEVMVITNTHELGPSDWRAGPLVAHPVTIEDGVWLGARSIVLPGVTVGKGAIVAAGAVVNRDVPPDSLVAGVPARVVRRLDA